MAAKEEGIAEVPCVYADHLTEAQKKAYILADNRMALDAGWDEELLAVEMEELQNLGFARNLLLWSEMDNGIDPESSQGNNNMAGAFERFSLPGTSSYGFGITVKF